MAAFSLIFVLIGWFFFIFEFNDYMRKSIFEEHQKMSKDRENIRKKILGEKW